jgi:3-deoxy-D-manno-octulosonic-acid transferase
MVAAEVAFSIENADELTEKISSLLMDISRLDNISASAGKYVKERTGATRRIMEVLKHDLKG